MEKSSLCLDRQDHATEVTSLDTLAELQLSAEGGGADDVSRSLSLTQLADKLDTMVNRLEGIENDVTALKKGEADLGNITSSLANDVKTPQTSTSALQETTAQASKPVAFLAKYIDTEKTQMWQPIVFRTVQGNEGDCYDKATGVFTTRDPGTYVFTASVHTSVHSSQPDKPVEAWIVVDQEPIALLRGSSSSTGSSSVSLQLSAGQTVWLRSYENDAACYDTDRTCFTGARVMPQ